MPALTTARRSELRAKAHRLAPVVMIGDKGLSDSVIAEVDRALKAHELVKVKAATDDREARVAWMAATLRAPRGDFGAAHRKDTRHLARESGQGAQAREDCAQAQECAEAAQEARHLSASAQGAPHRRGAHSYRTSTISYSFTPPGALTSTTSPAYFPMSALAIGEE